MSLKEYTRNKYNGRYQGDGLEFFHNDDEFWRDQRVHVTFVEHNREASEVVTYNLNDIK